MKIYCAGPIKGNSSYHKNYSDIIRIVESFGHTALTENSLQFDSTIKLDEKLIYKRDINWIGESDIMIAEVSGPSLGVGFEISYGLFVKNIPVLAIYQSDAPSVSSMITGCDHPNLTLRKYNGQEELSGIISQFLTKPKSN
jgi:nucleoside 2-deoxyribosyltransferase